MHKFSQDPVLVWLPGKSHVSLWNGHKRTRMSSCLAFQLCEHITFVWVQVKSVRYELSLQEFLNFLKSMWARLVKGVSFAFLVHVNICCGAVCDVYSELPYYMCESSECSCASGRELIFFFQAFLSNPSLIDWDMKTFDALLPFHKVWSAKYLNYSMLKSNNILCDWNIRNSFPNTKSQLSFSKR